MQARQIAPIPVAALGIAVWGAISAINGLLIAYQFGQGNFFGGIALSVIYVLLPAYMVYRFVRLAVGFRDEGRLRRIGLPLVLTVLAPFAEMLVVSG